jgi:uncharacterized protein YbjT (DUF2867 family)
MIAVVGAAGPTGFQCAKRLLNEGTSVRCVVRTVEKCQAKFDEEKLVSSELPLENLTVVKGDVTDEKSLRDAFDGCEGVIFAASASSYCGQGGAWEVDNLGVQNTTRAAAAAGVGRVVLVSSRLVNPKLRFYHPIRAILNNVKFKLMDYKFLGEEYLRNSHQEYTIVRPGALVGGDGSQRGNAPGEEYIVAAAPEGEMGGARSIHRADVAAVVCEALRSPEAKNKTFEIASLPRGLSPRGGNVLPNFDDRLKEIFTPVVVSYGESPNGD